MSLYPYIPHTDAEIKEMLKVVGVDDINGLYNDVANLLDKELKLPERSDEFSVTRELKELAEKNINLQDVAVFRGAGIYKHYIPSAVYALATRSEFVTAYTPYQAEVSQGTLQALYEFQTMISELTGMEVANASMYDGGSALAEAALMSVRVTRKSGIVVAKSVHPEYLQVTKTYCSAQNIDVKTVDYDVESGELNLDDLENKLSNDIAAVVVGYPNFFGVIEDIKKIRESIPANVMLIVVANPIALAILEAPGKLGADIVVGEGQPLGNLPYLGGPGFGFFASHQKHMRKMPGRIIGETTDVDGKKGYVMILQTREQHIRRDKATSNICSNQSLNTVIASIYMSLMGKEGLREVAKRSFDKTHYLAERLAKIEGLTPVFKGPYFHEVLFRVSDDLESINKKLMERKIMGPLNVEFLYPELANCGLFCATEALRNEDIEFLLGCLEEIE